MKIEVEELTPDLFAELTPLAQKCWDENTEVKGEDCFAYGQRDFTIEPNYEFYDTLKSQKILALLTMRREGILVGYAVGMLYRSPHHRRYLVGGVDSFYIEPEFRSYGVVLVARIEQLLQSMGAQLMGWPVHKNSPVFALLKARGYVGDDIVMEKNLCVLQ